MKLNTGIYLQRMKAQMYCESLFSKYNGRWRPGRPILQGIVSYIEMYKIRYFFMLKYFMKYFGNVSVFNEIFQNAMPLFGDGLSLPGAAFGSGGPKPIVHALFVSAAMGPWHKI